eukprot:135942-Chlamydomonas_euryale.AAC.1
MAQSGRSWHPARGAVGCDKRPHAADSDIGAASRCCREASRGRGLGVRERPTNAKAAATARGRGWRRAAARVDATPT